MSTESTQERAASEHADHAGTAIDPATLAKPGNNESTGQATSQDGSSKPDPSVETPKKLKSPYDADSASATELPDQPTGNLPKWLLFNLVCPLLLLAAAGGIVVQLGSVESPARPPIDDTQAGRLFALPAVDVTPVRSLKSTGQKLQLTTDGTVVPYREIMLATEVAGQIVEKSVLCEAGKFVKKGEMLMTIDPTDYELEVKRLQRLQQQEYESLAEIDQEMANTEKSKELALADIELQQRELKRRQALPDQFASKGEVDQARRSLLQAEQSLLLLQNQFDLAKKRRVRLQSTEQLAKMQLEAAENNLKRTTITAPMDGVIVSEQAELNTFVARGSPVVTMEDTSKVEVAASLRTDQLYWVLNQSRDTNASGDVVLSKPDGTQVRGYQLPSTPVRVEYQLSGRDDLIYQWQGQLIGYDGIGLDEQTRTVPVRIVVDQPQQFVVKRDGQVIRTHGDSSANAVVAGPTTLVRGMFVKLRLELSPAVDLVILPSEALKPGNRVWQFIPDASVLNASLDIQAVLDQPGVADEILDSDSPVAVDVPARTAEEEKASIDALAAKGFDPVKWVPGKLEIIPNVRPVDRFVSQASPGQASPGQGLPGQGSRGPSFTITDDEGDMQYWVCEVPPPDADSSSGDTASNLKDGAYVIVSPLGSLPANVLPVRASSDIVATAGESIE